MLLQITHASVVLELEAMWCFCEGKSSTDLRLFLRLSVECDPNLKQYVRLPGVCVAIEAC